MKILKWFLLSLGVVVLLGGGYILYEFKFKTYDVADAEVDQIVEEGYEIELPDGTTMKVASDGTIIEEKSEPNAGEAEQSEGKPNKEEVSTAHAASQEPAAGSVSAAPQPEKTQTDKAVKEEAPVKEELASAKPANPQPSTPPAAKPKPVTAESIKEKYRGTLVSLQQQAETRVDNLVEAAKKEYAQKKADGEKISAGYFYTKYMGSSGSLESSTDAAFEGLMKALEAELAANGFNKSESQSFRDEYNQTKEEMRSSLMKRALAEMR